MGMWGELFGLKQQRMWGWVSRSLASARRLAMCESLNGAGSETLAGESLVCRPRREQISSTVTSVKVCGISSWESTERWTNKAWE